MIGGILWRMEHMPFCAHIRVYFVSCHVKCLSQIKITVTDTPRWQGGPRDRAAMGLEPTTPHESAARAAVRAP